MYINISQPEQLLHPISYIRKVSGAELKTRAQAGVWEELEVVPVCAFTGGMLTSKHISFSVFLCRASAFVIGRKTE